MTRWDTLQPPDIYLSEAVNEIYIFFTFYIVIQYNIE